MSDISEIISKMVGLHCCRQRVGEWKVISIGFGKKVYHDDKTLIDPFYGEWEIVAYNASWRVTKGDEILCSSNDLDSTDELNEVFSHITLGTLSAIQKVSKFDVCLVFDKNINVEFMAMSRDSEDELVRIFGPDQIIADYFVKAGWVIEYSNKPQPA